MKKFIAIVSCLVMIMAMSIAMAAPTEISHNNNPALPQTSSQQVKITISALRNNNGGENDGTVLPSEYHVLVNWDKTDGLYKPTLSDSTSAGGFKNFSWDCGTLNYIVNTYEGSGEDPRIANWGAEANRPKVRFEVVNASTPDLYIQATAALDGTDAWAAYIDGDSIAAQNQNIIGTQTVAPVLQSNLGSGKNSYEDVAQAWGQTQHNEYEYTYTFDWDYDALNERALERFVAGATAAEELTNTFTVTVSAAAASGSGN